MYENNDVWESLSEQNLAERGWSYLELSNQAHESGSYLRSLTLAQAAIDAFDKDADEVGVAEARASAAVSLKVLNRFDEAVSEMTLAVEVLSNRTNPREWDFRRTLAKWFLEERQYIQAKTQAEMCLKEHLYEDNLCCAAEDFITLAYISCETGDCDESISLLRRAKAILEVEKQVVRVADVNSYLSGCFNHQEDSENALAHARRALAVFTSANKLEKIAFSYNLIGRAEILRRNYELALSYLGRAHKIVVSQEPVNFYALYQIQKNKAKALRAMGRSEEASDMEIQNSIINETLSYHSK